MSFMQKQQHFIRKTISLSSQLEEIINNAAKEEFSGNASAFIAHTVLHYIKCQRCTLNNANQTLKNVDKESVNDDVE